MSLMRIIHSEIRFGIYEIFPMSEAPSFEQLGMLTYDRIDVDAYAMVGDRFAFHWEQRVVVWDYTLDRSVCWAYTPHLSDVS